VRRPRALAAAIALAAIVVAVSGWAAARRPDGDPGWVEVERGDVVRTVEVVGRLASEESVSLGPPPVPETWDYKITWMATEGTEVGEGDPVVRFDTTDLERRLEERRNEVAQADKEIEKLDAELVRQDIDDDLALAEARARERKAALAVDRPGELSAAAELERARLDLREARLDIAHLERKRDGARASGAARRAVLLGRRERARGQVREIEAAIEAMTVRAPRRGTVIHVSDWRDEKKKVGDSAWKGEKVVELPDLARMMGEGEVDEALAGRVAVGQPVLLRLDAHPDVEFRAAVASVWRTVKRRSWQTPEKVFRLDLALEGTDVARMRPGMRFRGTIEVGRVPDAVRVPAEAVFAGADGPVVHRRTAWGSETVPVTVGERTADVVEIVAGVVPGDRVATREPGASR